MNKNNYSMRTRLTRFRGWLLMATILGMFSAQVRAQVANYQFSQSLGTYTPITGGTVLTSSTTADDDVFLNQAIGFSFTYNGTAYSAISVNVNGLIAMGTTISSSYTGISSGSTNNVIAPYNNDLNGQTGTGFEIRMETIGSSPNRVCVVQWTGVRPYNVAGFDMDFQARLYETSNVVEFAYGTQTVTNATLQAAEVGIRGASTADFHSRTFANATTGYGVGVFGWSNSAQATAASQTMRINTLTRPTSGLTFTYTPGGACSGTPTGGTAVLSSLAMSACGASGAPSPGTLYVHGHTNGQGITYQWQSSTTSGGPYANVVGGTGATTPQFAPASAAVTTYYVLRTTCSGNNAFSNEITVSTGAVAPQIQTSSIQATTIGTTSLALTWLAGSGNQGKVVYINSTNSFTPPANGVSPTAATAYVSGQQCVFNGTGSTVTVTGLTPGTTYYIRAYEANCSGAALRTYQTATATNNPATIATAPCLPTAAATNITTSALGNTTATITWTNGTGLNGRVVYLNSTNSFTDPTNGVAPGASTTAWANAGQQQIYSGTGSSVSVTALTPGTTYYVRVYEYGCTTTNTTYLMTPGTNNPGTISTPACLPTTAATNVIAGAGTNYTSMFLTWTNGNGGGGRVVYLNSTNSFTDPTNGTNPTAAAAWTNTGQQCVYNGTAASVTVTGLLANTTYYARVYEYGCTGAAQEFLVSTGTNNPAAVSTLNRIQYTVARTTGITFTPVSGSGTTLATTGDDANSGSIVFPFPFTYAGETVSTFSMCTNGWMSLGTPKVALSTLTTFGNALQAVGSIRIAPFWDDLFVNTGQALKYEVVGTSPNRVLVCEWNSVEVFNYPGPSLTFQVKFYETSNVIEYDYGVMQGFDGTLGGANTVNGKPFTSTTGLSQGGTMSSPPVAGQLLGLQLVNTNAWTHLGFETGSAGFNAQTAIPECNSRYTFTPAGSVYAQDTRPGIPVPPVNDDPAGAITLSVPVTPPATYCGNFYTSNFATQTTGYTDHASTFGDDDVWFKFQANSTATTISVLGSAGYNAVIQLFDGGATDTGAPLSGTALAGVNATNMTGAVNSAGLTETFTAANAATTVGNYYYVRVYHAGGGTQATATATVTAGSVTGYTVTAGGSGYITANSVAPIIYLEGPTGLQGVQANLTISGGAVTAVTTQGAQNGYGAIGAGVITVKIPNPGNGVTGDFAINVFATPTPPANDEASGAVTLTPGATCITTSGNTINATGSAPATCTANPDDDVWYSFVADAPSLTVTVEGIGAFNPAVEGFSTSGGAVYANFTSLGCSNSTGAAGTETLNLTGMTVGNTYYVRVYSSANGSTNQGAFTVCMTGTAPGCATLSAPANAALVGTSVTLSWTGAGTSYTVYSDATNPPTTAIYTGALTSYVHTGYPVGVQQFWRVEASNPYGTASPCTTVRSFTRDACPTPTALSATTTVTGAVLSWTEMDVATTWDIEWLLNSSTATGTPNVTGTSTNPHTLSGLTAGTVYKFYVRANCGGPNSPWAGPFVFTTKPANDDCASAIALTVNADLACGTVTAGSLTGATASAGPVSSCGTFDDDVWYSFVATATSHPISFINGGGSTTDLAFQVLDGCAATSALICSDPQAATATGLTIGLTYYIRVATWTATTGQTSTFDVCVGTFPPPPSNDECASATSVTVNTGTTCTSTTAGTVTSATASTGPASTCGTFDDDVWFSFVATSVTHTVTITNVASSFFGDYSFQVLSSCGAGTALICSDPSSGNVTGLTPTQTYYIRVASFSSTGGQTGTFTVCVSTPPPPPANDNCAGAITISGLNATCTNTTVNTANATASGVSVCSGTADEDVWYSFTVPTGETDILYSTTDISGSPDRMFMLYDACGGTEVACEDDESGSFTGLTGGSTYKLRIFTWGSGNNTSFTLCLQTPPPPPANDDCVSATSLPVNAFGGCVTTAGTTLSSTDSGLPAPACSFATTFTDVFYSFNSGSNTSVILNVTLGSASGLGYEIYSDCSNISASTPNCSTFISGNTTISGLTASTSYIIRIYSSDFNTPGSFTICLTAPPAPPVNDAACNATTLTVGAGCTTTLATVLGATDELEFADTQCGGTHSNDVWFKFVAPLAVPSNTSHVIISTELNTGGVTDGFMELYSASGTCPGGLTLTDEACDDDTNGLLPVIDINTLNAGQTYYVRFMNYGATFTHNGSFRICVVNAGTPPPAIDNIASALNIPANANWYPQCQNFAGDCTLSSNSAESTNSTGVDNWYRFLANTTAVSIEMTSASMNNFIELVRETAPGVYTSVNFENANFATGGTERLNFNGLIVGQTYYVAVGSTTTSGGSYNVCIKQLLPSGCNTNTSNPLDVCGTFKATWTGANSYTYNFAPTTTSTSGGTLTSTGTISLGNTALNLLPGLAYNVIVNATYNLTNGVGTAEAPITVFGSNPSCANVQIAAHASVEVRASQRCTQPATLLRTSYMRTDPFVCGVTNYTYEFTPVTDCSGTTTNGAPFTYNNTSRIIRLNFAGTTTSPTGQTILTQTYYRVRVRPNFGVSGVNQGVYGNPQVIFVGGSALDVENDLTNMAAEADRMVEGDMIDANIYPNPSNGELVNLNVSNINSDNVFVRIIDATGRVVYTNRYSVEGSLNTVVTFAQPLASGLYTVEFVMDNERVTERMMIQK